MPDRQQLVAQAARHLQSGDFLAARQVLEPLCAGDAPVDDAVQLLAAAQSRLGNEGAATTLYRRYLQHNSANPAVWNNFGNHLKKSQPEQALQHYQRALELQPEYPDALYNLALCQHQLDRHADALASLNRLAAQVQQPREKQLRGIIHLALHQAEAARENFTTYLAMKPGDSSALLNLAIAHRRLGQREEALEILARAGESAPEDLLRERCALLQELGHRDQARQGLLALLAAQPLDLEAHSMLDRLLYEIGERASVGHSLRAAHLQTGNPALLSQLALLLEKIDRSGEAREVLSRISDLAQADPDLQRLQARLYERAGTLELAQQTFDSALQRFPDHRDLLLDYCRLRIRRGDLAEGESLMHRLLQEQPLDQEAWSYRSSIWKLSGDPRYTWLCDYDRFVGEQQLLGEGLGQDYIEELSAYLRQLHDARHAPMDQTLRGGTQTAGALFNHQHPLIQTLVDRLRVLVSRHIEQLPDDQGHPLLSRKTRDIVFNGSWSVRLSSQGYHINHNHRLGWLSSALYLALPPATGGADNAGCLQLGQSNLGLGSDLDPPERIITPTPGKLALFPSYLWHGTVPFRSEGERLTVAFDIVPGNDNKPAGREFQKTEVR